MALSNLAEILLVINGENAGALRAIRSTQAALAELDGAALKSQSGVEALASGFQKVGGIVAAAGVIVGAVGVKMAADFQSQMTLLVTHANIGAGAFGNAADHVKSLSDAILKMAPGVGFGPTELAHAFYHVESVMTSLPQALRNDSSALDILSQSAKLAAIGHADLEDTVNAVVSTLTVYSRSGYTASQITGILNRAIGEGNMRMQEFATALGTGILPVAQEAGLKLESLGAAMATLSDAGIPASRASTYLRSALLQLEMPSNAAYKALVAVGLGEEEASQRTADFSLVLQKAGINQTQVAAKLRATGSLADTIQFLTDKLTAAGLSAPQAAALIDKAFGGIRSGTGVVTLTQNLQGLHDKEKDATTAAKDFNSVWDYFQSHDPAFLFKQLQAALSTLSVTIGNRILPFVAPLAKMLADTAASTNGWVKALADLATGFGAVLVGLSALAFLLPFLTAGFSMMLGPVGIAIGVLVGGAILIQRNWSTVGPFLVGVADQVRHAFERIQDIMGRLNAGGSAAQAIFGALTGSHGGRAGPQEGGRSLPHGVTAGGGVPDIAGFEGGEGRQRLGYIPRSTQQAAALAGPQGRRQEDQESGVRLGFAPAGRTLTPAAQRAAGLGRTGGALGLERGEIQQAGGPAAPGPGPTGAAQLANTLGPAIDRIVDVIGRLRKAWGELTTGFQNGARPLTILVGVLMDLGVSGDKAVGIAHFLDAAWRLVSNAFSAFAGFIGPLLVNLFKNGIQPALADIQRNLAPLGREFGDAFHEWEPILKVIGAVLGALLAGALKGLITALTVALPIAVHIVIDLFHILADVLKIVADMMRGDWRNLLRDLWSLAQHAFDLLLSLFHLFSDTGQALLRGFAQGVVDWFLWLYHQLVGGSIVPDLMSRVTGLFGQMISTVWSAVDSWVYNLVKRFEELRDGVAAAAKQLAGILIDTLGNGLNKSIELFRNFIDAVNKILGFFHVQGVKVEGFLQTGLDVPGMKRAIGLATGGMITNGPYVIGEGDPTAPEYVLPTDRKYRARAMGLLESYVRAIGLAGGGTIPTSGSDGECVEFAEQYLGVHWPVSAAKELVKYMNSDTAKPGEAAVFTAGPYGHVAIVTGTESGGGFPVVDSNWVGHHQIGTHVMNRSMYGFAGFIDLGKPLGSLAGAGGGGGFNPLGLIDGAVKAAQGALTGLPEWVRGLSSNILDQIVGGVKGMLSSSFAGNLTGAVSGSHADWLHAAEKMAGVGPDWDQGLGIIIDHESGWNPSARNNSDSNAAAGNASVGLMQLTGTNRARYDPDESPVGQIVGGIKYILSRYGGIGNVPGVRSVLAGGHYVPYDAGGLLPPGLTMAWNGTGSHEVVSPAGAGGLGELVAEQRRTNQLLHAILHDQNAPAGGYAANLRAG